MARILAALLLMLAALAPASAEEKLLPWQVKAKELLFKEFPRAKDVGWPNGTTSLWIFMYTPKFDYAYDVVTSNFVCPLLERAGKPKGTIVIVTYWSFEGWAVGKSRILAKAPCE